MKLMKLCTTSLLLVFLAAPAFAQGHDDCPPDTPRHVALTALTHGAMEAAYVASFRGLYHRDPTGVPHSGPDDTGYWITTFDHYGAYSDGVCRAGWNAYAEMRLQCPDCSADPKLGDQPARFLPAAPVAGIPITPITPITPPAPLPSVMTCPDTSLQLAALQAIVVARFDELVRRVDLVDQNVTAGRAENTTFFAAVTKHWKAIVGTVGTAVVGYIGGKKL